MRRARIKAVATVPVRRKAAQDNAGAETTRQDDVKVSDKPSEVKIEPKTESITTIVDNKEPEETVTTALLEKQPISDVIQKESIEPVTPEVFKQTDTENVIQPVSKCNSTQKITAPNVEGTYHFIMSLNINNSYNIVVLSNSEIRKIKFIFFKMLQIYQSQQHQRLIVHKNRIIHL